MHQDSRRYIVSLRIIHGILTVYFILCLLYLYIVGLTGDVDRTLFIIAVSSLTIEGIAVFAFNQGDCPLIHVQKRIGDGKPFFELLLPSRLAKRAIPIFALLTMIAIFIVLMRFVK